MPTLKCSACSQLHFEGKFCIHCGKPLEILACLHCGNRIYPLASFCGNCGEKIKPIFVKVT